MSFGTEKRELSSPNKDPSSSTHTITLIEKVLSSQMGALQATVLLCLVLLHLCSNILAQDEDWKTATATYSKETDGSIITGTLLASSLTILQKFQAFDFILGFQGLLYAKFSIF